VAFGKQGSKNKQNANLRKFRQKNKIKIMMEHLTLFFYVKSILIVKFTFYGCVVLNDLDWFLTNIYRWKPWETSLARSSGLVKMIVLLNPSNFWVRWKKFTFYCSHLGNIITAILGQVRQLQNHPKRIFFTRNLSKVWTLKYILSAISTLTPYFLHLYSFVHMS